MPNDADIPAETFCRWLIEIKAAGVAKRDHEIAAMLGVSANSIVAMKRDGVNGSAAGRTALAMSAMAAGLEPYR